MISRGAAWHCAASSGSAARTVILTFLDTVGYYIPAGALLLALLALLGADTALARLGCCYTPLAGRAGTRCGGRGRGSIPILRPMG